MGDNDRKVHSCKRAECKVKISKYDPHSLCDNCRYNLDIPVYKIDRRCEECASFSDEQFKEMLAKLHDNSRKRQNRSKSGSSLTPTVIVKSSSTEGSLNQLIPPVSIEEATTVPASISPIVTPPIDISQQLSAFMSDITTLVKSQLDSVRANLAMH